MLLLRVAAALALVQGLAHGILFIRARPTHGPTEVAVIEAMKTNSFNFRGAVRSYWDMYFGYGLEAAAACLVEAVLLWMLADIAKTQPALVRPILGVFVVANLGHIALTARYFFYVPIVFDLAIAITLVWAFVRAA